MFKSLHKSKDSDTRDLIETALLASQIRVLPGLRTGTAVCRLRESLRISHDTNHVFDVSRLNQCLTVAWAL
jgi:hypothetical protein